VLHHQEQLRIWAIASTIEHWTFIHSFIQELKKFCFWFSRPESTDFISAFAWRLDFEFDDSCNYHVFMVDLSMLNMLSLISLIFIKNWVS
jgi:hypothetical protein